MKSLQAKGTARAEINSVVEGGVCREQGKLDGGNGLTLAVLVWGPWGSATVWAFGGTMNLLGFEGGSQGCNAKTQRI